MTGEKICKDYGDNPLCEKVADGRYTMDFTDVEPGAYIYWCAHCGPAAKAMNDALQARFSENDPEFKRKLATAIEAAEAQKVIQKQ